MGIKISVDDWLRKQVKVVHALGHVQSDPQLRQDVHGASLLV